jgi:tRNA (guanine37-N1)-methyltransferase
MRIDIITLFPSMFRGPFDESIIKRARKKGILEINLHNLRDFTDDRHRTVDDLPYGGGAGMVMKPEPLFRAVEKVKEEKRSSWKVILLSPQGQPFAQEKAKELAEEEGLIFICGHYEGVDERVREHLIDEELSLGDFVLTGGELAAMVIVDAIARMLPEVLGCKDSIREDSFYQTLLDYPHYTRPTEFRGWKVPGVLISGNHQKIREWRKKKKLENTFKKRPDLLRTAKLSREEEKMLEQIRRARTEH